jgi:Protein of unknown function (DUF3830)
MDDHSLVLDFVDDGLTARARFLDQLAPSTCSAMRKLASMAPDLLAVHAAFTGRELSVRISQELASRIDGLATPPENQTLFPIPGDLVWSHLPPYAWSGVTEPLFDLGIFYGRDSRLLLPVGWLPGNRFAEIFRDDLPALAKLAAETQVKGAKRVRLQLA